MKPRNVAHAIRELLHHTSSAHQMAVGFTLGLALSMIPVPFVGLLVSLGLASLLRANLVATYLGTAIMNPVTGPFVLFAELWVGVRFLDGEMPTWEVLSAYGALQWWALVRDMAWPFVVGAGLFMGVAAVAGYPLSFAAAKRLRARMDRRLRERESRAA